MIFTMLFWIVLTAVAYAINRAFFLKWHRGWLNPIYLTSLFILLLLWLSQTSVESYVAATKPLLWMLGPATVAFAIPIFQHLPLIRKHGWVLLIGAVLGSAFAIVSALLLGYWLGVDAEIMKALPLRSISTPFALSSTHFFDASPQLAIMLIMLTGLSGVLLGELNLKLVPRVTDSVRGAAYGGAAHAQGTARARQIKEEAGVVASLMMIFSGILVCATAPWVGPLLLRFIA